MLDEMVSPLIDAKTLTDLNAGSAIDALLKSIETDMYFGGCPQHERGLRKVLQKFGVKSAKWEGSLIHGAPLQMEGLDAVLRQASFDMSKLKLWKP